MGPLDQELRHQLLIMSDRTIDRLLRPIKSHYPKRMGGTKPGSLLKKNIPVKTNQWNETIPGFVEADTVAHCGTSLLGSFVWSITLTDIFSGWTENAAVWNKGAHGVLTQIACIEKRWLCRNFLFCLKNSKTEFAIHATMPLTHKIAQMQMRFQS